MLRGLHRLPLSSPCLWIHNIKYVFVTSTLTNGQPSEIRIFFVFLSLWPRFIMKNHRFAAHLAFTDECECLWTFPNSYGIYTRKSLSCRPATGPEQRRFSEVRESIVALLHCPEKTLSHRNREISWQLAFNKRNKRKHTAAFHQGRQALIQSSNQSL